jgi:UDP-N-acetylmuramoyl-tripeptide--D-alanyl-D-alanine ligase
MKKKEDIWAENVDISLEGISFEACFKNGERIRIKTGVLGDYNISNILLCIAVAKKIGMTKEEIANGCSRITPEISGMGIKNTDHGFRAINSSYSANKSGVLAHFDYFKGLELGTKKTIVMPCIIELGREAKQTHYEIGRKAATACTSLIVTSRDHFDDFKRGALEGGMAEEAVLCIENPDICFDEIRKRSENGLVLFEGRSNPRLIDKVFGKEDA